MGGGGEGGSLRSKSAYGRLPSSYAANTDIHLVQLCVECIKASIHVLKLCHDVSQRHITRGRRGSECVSSRTRWSQMGGRCRILLSRPKLHLTTFYDNGIYGTYVSKGVGHGRRDEKMA